MKEVLIWIAIFHERTVNTQLTYKWIDVIYRYMLGHFVFGNNKELSMVLVI